jgi:hypothetical protein
VFQTHLSNQSMLLNQSHNQLLRKNVFRSQSSLVHIDNFSVTNIVELRISNGITHKNHVPKDSSPEYILGLPKKFTNFKTTDHGV